MGAGLEPALRGHRHPTSRMKLHDNPLAVLADRAGFATTPPDPSPFVVRAGEGARNPSRQRASRGCSVEARAASLALAGSTHPLERATMAVAGFKTRTFVTTAAGAPTAADVLQTNSQTDFNESAAELETNYQGEQFTSLITGKFSTEVSLTLDYDPAHANHAIYQRLYTAFRNRTIAYVSVDFAGDGSGQQVGVRVTAWQRSASQDGKVTATPTLRSCTAVADVTCPVIAL